MTSQTGPVPGWCRWQSHGIPCWVSFQRRPPQTSHRLGRNVVRTWWSGRLRSEHREHNTEVLQGSRRREGHRAISFITMCFGIQSIMKDIKPYANKGQPQGHLSFVKHNVKFEKWNSWPVWKGHVSTKILLHWFSIVSSIFETPWQALTACDSCPHTNVIILLVTPDDSLPVTGSSWNGSLLPTNTCAHTYTFAYPACRGWHWGDQSLDSSLLAHRSLH